MVIINRYMPDVFISSIDLVYLCKICVKICKVTLLPICVLLVLYLPVILAREVAYGAALIKWDGVLVPFLEGMSSVLCAFCHAAFGLTPISSPLGLV